MILTMQDILAVIVDSLGLFTALVVLGILILATKKK